MKSQNNFSKIVSIFAVLMLAIALLLPLQSASAGETTKIDTIIVQSGSGPLRMNVLVASKAKELRRGLMHRRTIAPYDGMLFDFGRQKPVSMWMKDTPLALDMLFIDHTGRIVHVHENATPLSEEPIASPQPVRAVLEILAGEAKAKNITQGNMVVHPMFKQKVIRDIQPQAGAAKTPTP